MSRKSLVASLAIFPLAGAVAGGRHAPRPGLKDGFLATLSHELRTPPNAIVGWAHLLQRGQLAPDEVSRAIDTILRSATAQTQIIDELLDVSRIVTGKLQLDLRTVSLSSAVCVCCPFDRGGQIPAAALSAYAGAEDRRKALLAGFQHHIPKPVDPAHLLAVIAKMARKSAGRNEER